MVKQSSMCGVISTIVQGNFVCLKGILLGSVGAVLPSHHYHFYTPKNRPQMPVLPIVRDPFGIPLCPGILFRMWPVYVFACDCRQEEMLNDNVKNMSTKYQILESSYGKY